jgi:hypothetical protein
MMSYQCKNPVVIIIFNRPQYTQRVFEQIRKVKPQKLYIISDGPRENLESDVNNVSTCREITSNVDWPCEVVKIFSDNNLGCKKRVITGLNEVFFNEDRAIILEDDCVPTEAFFQFCDWGLERYNNNRQVAVVSGSNLLDYDSSIPIDEDIRAGFSMYINCWGWATWRDKWNKLDSFLSIQELNSKIKSILKSTPLSKNEKVFWTGVFRHSINTRTIWDFYLQYVFFKESFVSVYPRYNLVENIGFGSDSTHTHTMPEFVEKSWPKRDKFNRLMELREPEKVEINKGRDRLVIRVIYGYSKFSTLKLSLGNILRYLGLI